MGGTSGGDDDQIDNIWIMDIDTMEFSECKIMCPEANNYHAINMSDRGNADLLMFGYIRDLWELSEFSDILYPPDGLIKLMAMFCSTEVIHLISEHGEHCKIALADILQHCA